MVSSFSGWINYFEVSAVPYSILEYANTKYPHVLNQISHENNSIQINKISENNAIQNSKKIHNRRVRFSN